MREADPGWTMLVLVCANHRPETAQRPSCAHHDGVAFRRWLKDRLDERGLRNRVMVSNSGCLGVCSREGVTVGILTDVGRQILVVKPDEEREAAWQRICAALG